MENNESNGMGNAAWGNASWGNTPPWGWGQQKNGPSGTDIAALTLGIVGTGLGLMSGGLGIFNNRNGGPNGNGQGGPNLYQQIQELQAELANTKADVAVNTQRDVDLAKQTELMIENAKLQSKLDVKESEQKLTGLITMVNNQVITNAQKIACLENDFNKLIQIGIPSSNIITPPTATTTTSTAGA